MRYATKSSLFYAKQFVPKCITTIDFQTVRLTAVQWRYRKSFLRVF